MYHESLERSQAIPFEDETNRVPNPETPRVPKGPSVRSCARKDLAEYESWREERLDLGVDPEGLNAQSLELWCLGGRWLEWGLLKRAISLGGRVGWDLNELK